MRRTVPIPSTPFVAAALRDQDTFLFRRMGDQRRALLGVGVLEWVDAPRFTAGGNVEDWTFGHIAYEMKNELEPLRSRHQDRIGFPVQRWFIPRWVVEWSGEEAQVHVLPGDEASALAFVERMRGSVTATTCPPLGPWERRTSRGDYLERAHRLLHHIQRGDIYEVNYCIERTCRMPGWDPFAGFEMLDRQARAPFTGFYRLDGRFALCASPERFLAFDGKRVLGQPMKGTRPRSSDPT